MKPPSNKPSFARKGFSTFHDPSGTYQPLGVQDKQAGLPQNPANVVEAAKADIQSAPDMLERQPQQRIRRYGGIYETPD
jgi:hypothetical protein